VNGYTPGVTEPSQYLGQELEASSVLAPDQQQAFLAWVAAHHVRGAPVEFRIALGRSALGWQSDAEHSNIGHAGRRDQAVYLGAGHFRHLFTAGQEADRQQVLDHDEYRHLAEPAFDHDAALLADGSPNPEHAAYHARLARAGTVIADLEAAATAPAAAPTIPAVDVSKATERFEEILRTIEAERPPKLVDGVKEVLEALHRSGVRLSIATGAMPERARRGPIHLGVAAFFTDAHTGKMRLTSSPIDKSVAIQQALDAVRDGETVIMIGDGQHDMEQARQVRNDPHPTAGALVRIGRIENPAALRPEEFGAHHYVKTFDGATWDPATHTLSFLDPVHSRVARVENVHAVVWDFDGTISASAENAVEAFGRLSAELLGRTEADADYWDAFALGARLLRDTTGLQLVQQIQRLADLEEFRALARAREPSGPVALATVALGGVAERISRRLHRAVFRVKPNAEDVLRYHYQLPGQPVAMGRAAEGYRQREQPMMTSSGIELLLAFVPEREKYNPPLPRSQPPQPGTERVDQPHEDQECFFCKLPRIAPHEFFDEYVGPTGLRYHLGLNTNEYGTDHVMLVAADRVSQVQDRDRLRDMLLFTRARGPAYESWVNGQGAGASKGGHWHVLSAGFRAPVWKAIDRGQLPWRSSHATSSGVVYGELDRWPARVRLYRSADIEALAPVVMRDLEDLYRRQVPVSLLMRVKADGAFEVVLGPMTWAFSTSKDWLFDPEGTPEPTHVVSRTGAAEVPGGLALIYRSFRDQPLTAEQSQRAADRFARMMHDLSNWTWQALPSPACSRSGERVFFDPV
jgi:phosphoglycolate phosphatase-like HAD superfamily hydrolase